MSPDSREDRAARPYAQRSGKQMDSTYLNDKTEPTNPHGLSARSIHTLWEALDARMGFLKGTLYRSTHRSPRQWWESNAPHLVAVIQWIEGLAKDVGYDLGAPMDFGWWPDGWTEIMPAHPYVEGQDSRPVDADATLTERMIIDHVRAKALAAQEALTLRKEIKERQAALKALSQAAPVPSKAPALTVVGGGRR